MGHEFCDVETVTSELLKCLRNYYKYEDICLKVKKVHPVYGQIYWNGSCKKRTDGCPFKINIVKRPDDMWAKVTLCEDVHNHSCLTPDGVQLVSGSNSTVVMVGDLLPFEEEIKQRLSAAIDSNLEVRTLRNQLLAEKFGPNCCMDSAAQRKLRTWKDNIKRCNSSVNATKHCKEDNFVEYLKTK